MFLFVFTLLLFGKDIMEGRNGKKKPGIEKDGIDDPVFLRFVCYSMNPPMTAAAATNRPMMASWERGSRAGVEGRWRPGSGRDRRFRRSRCAC